MATVKMKKGSKFADVFDSPETIRQAQREGYSLVADSAGQQAETETAGAVKPPETGGVKGTVSGEQLIELTAKQLVKLGAELGVDVSKMTNKTEMVKALSAVEVTADVYDKYKA